MTLLGDFYILSMSFIRTLFGGLTLLLSLALAFWLVYSNDARVSIELAGVWDEGIPNPFRRAGGEATLQAPLGIWYLVFTVLGIFIGLFYGWFIGGETRVRARQQGRRARKAETDLATIKKESEAAKTEVDSLKTEKKDLEAKAKTAEAAVLAAPAEVKQITSA